MEQDEFWRSHVDAFLRQRSSQRDYCQQHGVPPRELRKWRTRFYGPVRRRPASEPDVAPAEAGISEFSYAGPSGPGVVASDLTVATPVIRRRWTEEQKRRLVWEGLNSGQPLARYARRHGIHASVVHRWLRAFALGRKNSLFAGSEGGATRWAIGASMVETGRLNGVEPFAWLCDSLTMMINGHPASHLDDLLPWSGRPSWP